MTKQCPICFSQQRFCFQETILKKYNVDYFYCDTCGLLQTEEPYWLNEAYESVIASADTGLIQRNIVLSQLLSCILFFSYDRQGKYLDIGGGYGMLTRLLRDIGFDMYWSDPYCENLFAQGFEATKASPPFNAITAFEVLEHIHNPLDFLQKSMIKASTSTVIFSTELFHNFPPAPRDWSYYAFNTGQHISFYQLRTLKYVAKTLSLSLLSHGNIHILTDQKINSIIFRLTTSRLLPILAIHVKKTMRSRTLIDYQKMMQLI